MFTTIFLTVLYAFSCSRPISATDHDQFSAEPISSILSPEIVHQWTFKYKPFHSRIPITKTQDVLNLLPIAIEFIMPSEHFKKYGALFQYFITTNYDSTIMIFEADYQIHQFTNSNNSMIKTQITDLQIMWTQLLNAQLDDFIHKEFGIIISFNDPALQSSRNNNDFYVSYHENALFFYNPTQQFTFNTVPSFFWSQDYGISHAQNTTMLADGVCIDIDKFRVDLDDASFTDKQPVFIQMIIDGSIAEEHATNVVEYDPKDNAYHFGEGFCLMHTPSSTSKVQFQIIQASDSKLLLSLAYRMGEGVVLRPLRFVGSTSQVNANREMVGELMPLHDTHSKFVFQTFRPYINRHKTAHKQPKSGMNVKKTCVYLKSAAIVKHVDTFSENDMFVKIIPDYDDQRSVRSATIKNNNSATWNEQLCFDGSLESLELHVFDVDNIGIGISEQLIGSVTVRPQQGTKQTDLRLNLTDISSAYVGGIVIDVIYVYDRKSISTTLKGIKATTNQTQATITGEIGVLKTCVGILKATFYGSTDLFNENDAFVQVIGGSSAQQTLQTKTIQNSNNPEWNQVLCFKGEVHNIRLNVYDVDRLLANRRTEVGSAAHNFTSKEQNNLELRLADNTTKDMGSVWIDLFYIYGPKPATSTQNPTSSPTSKPTPKPTQPPTEVQSPQALLFTPDSGYMQTCVHILRAAFDDQPLNMNKDVVVQIIADHDNEHSVKTKSVSNDNNPMWRETFCFQGEVEDLQFNIYDVDKSQNESMIGSASCSVIEHYYLELPVMDDYSYISGSLYVNIYFKYMNQTQKAQHKPSINLMDSTYMAKLSLYSDGYLFIGRGKCRDSEGRKPLYYHVELNPFERVMDDPHGVCRSYCNLDEDCLAYVYHISGIWKYYCALYVSIAIGEESALYPVVQSDGWIAVSNSDMEIAEISTIEPFNDADVQSLNDKVLGFCFVKTQAPASIIHETCINIHGFDPLVMNPPIILSAPVRAMSRPLSEEVSITLDNGKGRVCWEHGVQGFQLDFSSPSTGIWFIGSKSQPIGYTKGECSHKSTLRQKSHVFSTVETKVYDMSYDVIVDADHYGCCYGVHYKKHDVITYSRLMNLKLSQCVLDETKSGSTYFSYNVQCDQLKSLLDHKSEFIYIGDGGCRDEHNLAPSRYWHDKLEFHSCQLQCIGDTSCLGIMYMFQGRWKGRCLIYTSSTSLTQLFQDGNVIPHYGWKWIDADPSPTFERNTRKVEQALGTDGSGRCFAKRSLLAGESMKSFTTQAESLHDSDDDEDDDDELSQQVTIRISELNSQDPLSLPWPNQGLIFDTLLNNGDELQRVCILGQLQRLSFQTVDGEYILINARVHHNGKPVWYNKLNGYYLYWNMEQEELQILDDISDDDYFAALAKEKYWRLNDGEQDVYDQFLRIIPGACPESVCITVKGVVDTDVLPFSARAAWMEIHGTNGHIATNKTDATHSLPQWNQKFCLPPTPIALCQLVASDIVVADSSTTIQQAVLGKFHISPLTEGSITRTIFPSALISHDSTPILVQVEVGLNPWHAEGFYDPSDYMMASRSVASSDDGANILRIESDRSKWIGYVGHKMTMIVHAFGTKGNNVEWYLINPGPLDIAIDDLIVPDSEPNSPQSPAQNVSDLMQAAMSQWTVSSGDEYDATYSDVEPVKSAAILTVTPRKKMVYQIVVVSKEKDSDQTVSMEITVQVLKAPRSVADAPWIVEEEEMQQQSLDDLWDGEEHGKDMWIIWWVLGTIGLTFITVIVTFIMLRKRYFKTPISPKHEKKETQDIEMNKVGYHTVHKHTIKPQKKQQPPGVTPEIHERQALNV